MEYSWIVFALLASCTIWLYGFAQKIKAELPEQSDSGFIFYSYFAMTIAGFVWWIWNDFSLDFTHLTTFVYAFLITALYIVVIKTRLISLRFLSSSSYFINYRIISSTLLIWVGMVFFWDILSLEQFIWILLWFFVFYLLIEKKNQTETASDLKKWFIYLIIGAIAVTWLQTVGKDFAVSDFDIYTLVLYQGVLWCLMSLVLKWKESYKQVFKIHHYKQLLFLMGAGILFGLSTVFNLLALQEWNLAIVYKIISYSLFIPIILSIIIYREPVTSKKLIAVWLTIISIFLFF